MSAFLPQRICAPYHFDIRRSRQGLWIAGDRDGLIGGAFVTYKEALRFALFETGGDGTHVHTSAGPEVSRAVGAPLYSRDRTGA